MQIGYNFIKKRIHCGKFLAELPEIGVRVLATTAEGGQAHVRRVKMPRGGWAWKTDYDPCNLPKDAFVAWQESAHLTTTEPSAQADPVHQQHHPIMERDAMPVMSKPMHGKYETELRSRFENLMSQFKARDLAGAREGAGKGAWSDPDRMCATTGLAMDLRMAVEDFKAILAEVKSLK